MKKHLLLSLSSLLSATLALVLASGASFPVLSAGTFVPTGNLGYAARVNFVASDADQTSTLRVTPTKQDYSGDGLYLRMRNYTVTETPISLMLLDTSNHAVAPTASAAFYTYDAEGANKTERAFRSFGTYLLLPSNFDGFVYLPYASLSDLAGWSGNTSGSTMTYSAVYSVYFSVNTKYDSYASFAVGSLLTEAASILNPMALSESRFATTFVKDTNPDNLVLTRLPLTDFDPSTHDLSGGFLVNMAYDSTDVGAYFAVTTSSPNLAGEGLYLRVKNGVAAPIYVQFYLLATNGHRLAFKTNAPLYTYSTAGKSKTATTTRSFGSFFGIPASFDGFLFFPYASMQDDASWSGNSGTTMAYDSVYCLSFGLSPYYDSGACFAIGDIFTSSAFAYDGSASTAESFATQVSPDLNGHGEFVRLTHLPGYSGEATYDYAKVHSSLGLDGGAEVTFTATEADQLSTFLMEPTVKDISSAVALVFRIKNLSYDYPFRFLLTDSAGKSALSQGAVLGSFYFLDQAGVLTANAWGGNTSTVKIPTAFDGWLIAPLASFGGVAQLNLASLASIGFAVSTKYDSGFHSLFGGASYLDSSLSEHVILDPSSLTSASWPSAYAKGDNPDYLTLALYKEATGCPFIGDLKILNSLSFASDEAMNSEVTYNSADNALTYARSGDGLAITIGQYETNHANGPYSAIALMNNSHFTDRTVMTRTLPDGSTETAQGLSLYLKNTSRREIGLTLAFDESGATAERWTLVGYPAMYYAYDVVKDAFYTFYCKSDQLQLPVGFEGYVRIPFGSYLVPDWCHGVDFPGTDDILDLSKFSGNLYLSQDNRRYSDLSYFVKNVGVYFAETVGGSLFQSEHTIKSNMGL